MNVNGRNYLTVEIQRQEGTQQPKRLHFDFKEIPVGMSTLRCVQWMLARALEEVEKKCPDPLPPPTRVD